MSRFTNPLASLRQLELITELLGTPSMEDMRHACDGARTHMLRRVPKQPSLSALYTLSSHATHEAVHLLCQMLVFDPVSFPSPKRISFAAQTSS
jgi:nemo like kinase